jgi:ring-1,2-phenylacetyl-CoA epoxidase subunit PaaC
VTDQLEYLLGLGDDALIEAQRLSQWCARAPDLEEDIAVANIALDQLGAARLLLSHAGAVEGRGRDEDALAFLRDDRDFRNVLLAELVEPDFGYLLVKLLFLSAYQLCRYRALSGVAPDGCTAADDRLAAIAAKSAKESAYHVDHSSLWTIRLGDGTEESHRRAQDAVNWLWPYTHELFEADPDLREPWLSIVEPVMIEATLDRPADGWRPSGGRQGRHTEHLSYLLAEMQVLHRAHPGASW